MQPGGWQTKLFISTTDDRAALGLPCCLCGSSVSCPCTGGVDAV